MSQPAESSQAVRTALWILTAVAFVAAVAMVVRTLAVNYTTDLTAPWGTFWDFRDAGYFPVHAVLDRLVPYDVGGYLAAYPVAQEFPLLPPTYVALHAPFVIADLKTASLVMFALNLIGIVLLAGWSLSLGRFRVTPIRVLAVATLVVISTGGRNLLLSGQASLVFTAATYLALTASRETVGALGVFIALVKPSFGLPATVLVAAAGQWRRAVFGAGVAAIVSLFLMIPFVGWAGGVRSLLDILRANSLYTAASPGVDLATSTGRVDAAAAVANVFNVVPPTIVEIGLLLAVLGASAWVLFRRRFVLPIGDYGDAAIVLVSLTVTTGMYHSVYDLVILVLPAILLTRRDFAGGRTSPWLRWSILALIGVAAFNPFKVDSLVRLWNGPQSVVDVLGPGATAMAVLIATVLAAVVVLRIP
ncbi:MAG: glycosyltransferase family 87 protein, partial [Actinomycetota bacterium]|nr:glycosyltransferase family 87 protein [Actinomycetota bacterium]